MMEKTVFRIKNVSTGQFYKGYNGFSIWQKPHFGVRSFKHYFKKHPDDHPDWELKEYKLVEV